MSHREVFNLREAAEHLQCSVNWLREQIRSGKGPRYFTIGDHYRIRKQDLDSFVAARLQSTNQPSSAAV